MAVKLVISDIDGTLVQHLPYSDNLASADELIPQSAVNALDRLKAKNVSVSGATGRTYEQSKDILGRLGITGPCVFSGGAIIRDLPSGKLLYEANLTDQSIIEVQAIMSKYLADGRSIELNVSSVDPTKYNSIWAKLRKSDAELVAKELREVLDIYFVVNDGHGHNAEFGVAVLRAGTDKGSGTKKLLALLGIDASQAACIGDGANDIPMFNECRLGIAMGNGEDVLKRVATHVVAPIDNDGFSDAVDIVLR